jgi:RNA polymerase sigma-70 factor (ECF subfamily)
VYRRHSPLVHRRARALLGSDAEALDVVQDLFISLFERPEQFRAQSSLATFLYSATTRACWTRLRNGRTRARLLANAEHGAVSPVAHCAAEPLAELRELLGRLDQQLAEVAVFYYLDDMSHAEIAEVLGCSRRQVGYLLERMHAATRTERRAES